MLSLSFITGLSKTWASGTKVTQCDWTANGDAQIENTSSGGTRSQKMETWHVANNTPYAEANSHHTLTTDYMPEEMILRNFIIKQ